MDASLKVTETPQESSFSDLVSGDNLINIPLFQREYRWTSKNLSQFWDDIDEIIDGSKKSQFLGVLVTVPRPQELGQPHIFDIVDGQQRLFTCYIAILAAVKAGLDNGQISWALDVARSYLLLRPFSNYKVNTKLVPSFADRSQFATCWAEVSNHKALADGNYWNMIGEPVVPTPAGNQTGRLLSQYRRLIARYREAFDTKGFDYVSRIVKILVSNLSFVSISLRDPIAAPIIFERLNARGERITTSDLVRNEVFSRVADDPQKALAIFDNYWNPFHQKYVSRDVDLEKLLFPYGLIIDDNVTKADLFQRLRANWITVAATQNIISDLDRYTESLFALERGEKIENISQAANRKIRAFFEMSAPSSIFAFMFSAIEALKKSDYSEDEILSCFEVVEAFLVRRAVCGIEPTGLHSVFKGMWGEITQNEELQPIILSDRVKRVILARTTVSWPKDEDFGEAIATSNIYSRRICKYVLLEIDRSTGSETPHEEFWIEHILPQSLNAEWKLKFSSEQHEALHNTLANLIPLTSEMNQERSQKGFSSKREAFAKSKFASARKLAEEYGDWTPDTLEERAKSLRAWAIRRWPRD